MSHTTEPIESLVEQVRACIRCTDLPLGAKPIIQASADARILIVGQAPGRITHAKGRPFDDASGHRLRDWLGVDEAIFYDSQKFAILPMGFCFPGTGKGGDMAPRSECAAYWRRPLLAAMPKIELKLLLGRHALAWHLDTRQQPSLTRTVQHWRDYWPDYLPLPHPSPRNNRWLKNNAWFANEILPVLRGRVQELLAPQ